MIPSHHSHKHHHSEEYSASDVFEDENFDANDVADPMDPYMMVTAALTSTALNFDLLAGPSSLISVGNDSAKAAGLMDLLNDIDNHVNSMKIGLSKQVAAERNRRESMKSIRRKTLENKAAAAQAEAQGGTRRRRMSVSDDDVNSGTAARTRRVSIGVIAKPMLEVEAPVKKLKSAGNYGGAGNYRGAAPAAKPVVKGTASNYLAPSSAKISPEELEQPETSPSASPGPPATGPFTTLPSPSNAPISPKFKMAGPPNINSPAVTPTVKAALAHSQRDTIIPSLTPLSATHAPSVAGPATTTAITGSAATNPTPQPQFFKMQGPRVSLVKHTPSPTISPKSSLRPTITGFPKPPPSGNFRPTWFKSGKTSPTGGRNSPKGPTRTIDSGGGDHTIGRTLHRTMDASALQEVMKIKEEDEEVRRYDMAKEAFKLIDGNGDGFLQREEVLLALKNMNKQGVSLIPATMEAVDKMMGEIDVDGDGQIDMEEFIEMMQSAKSQFGDGEGGGMANALGGGRMSVLARNVLLAHERHREKENTIGNDNLIHPHDWKHASWDVLMSMLIMITVITMPLSLGWECLNERLFILNSCVDGLFLLDVAKNFNTGYIDENESIVMDRQRVILNYMTGYFVIDLLSSFPIDPFLDYVGGGGDESSCMDTLDAMLAADASTGASASELTKATKGLKTLKLLKMTRLFRLLRLSRVFKYMKMVVMWMEEKAHIRVSDGFTKLIKLGIGVLLICHWIGSFNFMICRMYSFPEDSWVVQTEIENMPAQTQWTWSFFKAMSMMIMIGFETPPFTNVGCNIRTDWCAIENWVTLCCLYIGAVFYSLLISSVASILNSSNMSNRIFEEKLGQLDDYMRSQKLPAALREKVKDHFHLQHADGKLFDEDEILSGVTPILRREIVAYKHREVLMKVPLLQNTEENEVFALEVATKLNIDIIFENEVVVRENMSGSEIFFIFSGVIEIYLESAADLTYVAIGDGCYFGEVSVMLGCKRTASARTKTQCVLYRISAANLKHLLVDYPEKQEYMLKVAKSRQKRIIHYLGMDKTKLDSADEQDEEDAKTDLFGVDADEMMMQKDEEFEKSRAHARISIKQHHAHKPTAKRSSELMGASDTLTSMQKFQQNNAALIERSPSGEGEGRRKSSFVSAQGILERRSGGEKGGMRERSAVRKKSNLGESSNLMALSMSAAMSSPEGQAELRRNSRLNN